MVADIIVDTLYLDIALRDAYVIGDAGHPYRIKKINDIKVNIRNMIVEYDTARAVTGMRIHYANRASIKGLEIHNATVTGVAFFHNYRTKVERCYINGTDFNNSGYGCSFIASQSCIFTNSFAVVLHGNSIKTMIANIVLQ